MTAYKGWLEQGDRPGSEVYIMRKIIPKNGTDVLILDTFFPFSN